MGHQIVRQPDGKYAIWSSNVNDFISVDCDGASDVIAELLDYAKHDIERRVKEVVEQLNRGERPYHQFTKSFDECVQIIRASDGDEAESLGLMDCMKKEAKP